MRMSFLHQTSSDCEQVYNASLEFQEYILHTLVQLNGFKPPDKHIILSSTPNCFQLLDPSSVSKHVDINNIDNSDLIKQRTPEWYSLRESCRVTGSTMFKALGFDTLSRQKEHHNTFVCGRSPPTHSSEVKEKLQHGTLNEQNILATLTGLILPSFLPPCYAFFEVGAKILKGSSLFDQVAVSTDGILKCTQGDTCLTCNEKKSIVVEFKSPFATKENPHVTTYDIPLRYVPQILCEMEAWESSELWLLCGTKQSVTLFQCYHDKRLLDNLLSTKNDLYGQEKPNIPMRLHPSVDNLKSQMKNYVQTNTIFKGEFPALTGEYGDVKESDVIPSAYGVTPLFSN